MNSDSSSPMRRELLIGCGADRSKKWKTPGYEEWSNLTTLDFNKDHRPDIVWDLEKLPYPFEENTFSEIHAYEVLEHTGAQGDWQFFFAQWQEFWRIMVDGGLFFATVPMWNSVWAWGDPSHKRIISYGTLVFLRQREYARQVGVTPMSDFRFYYSADFELVQQLETEHQYLFILRALKSNS